MEVAGIIPDFFSEPDQTTLILKIALKSINSISILFIKLKFMIMIIYSYKYVKQCAVLNGFSL